jgi:hypothetical protein
MSAFLDSTWSMMITKLKIFEIIIDEADKLT